MITYYPKILKNYNKILLEIIQESSKVIRCNKIYQMFRNMYNTGTEIDKTIQLLSIYPKNQKQGLERIFVYNVHRSIIHNSNNVETTQMSSDRKMNKQNVVYTNNEILLILKEE